MTLEQLGAPIDLHGGGKDLIFPHHTNEIAQSVAALSDDLRAEAYSRHWMHHGFVEIDSEKMSKSLGNFFTIREVLAKYDAEAMRLFLLGTHYRHPINYSDAILSEAEKRLVYLYETLQKAEQVAAGAAPAAEEPWLEDARRALDDDFNTPQVLGILAEVFTTANALADRKGKKTPEEKARLQAFVRDIRAIGATLGILQRAPAVALGAIRDRAAARRGIDPAAVERKIAERTAARKAKDFARGDAIRDELLAMGVAVLDGAQGTSWKVE
jgi:cysteinyl-tRNA synthetase